ELAQAFGAKGEALGQIDAARGKIADAENNIGYCKIYAKIAGKVGKANLTKGNIVNASASEGLLTTIVSVDPMYVYFSVPERAMFRYQDLLKKQFDKE